MNAEAEMITAISPGVEVESLVIQLCFGACCDDCTTTAFELKCIRRSHRKRPSSNSAVAVAFTRTVAVSGRSIGG